MQLWILSEKDTRNLVWSWLLLLSLAEILQITSVHVALANQTETIPTQPLPAFTSLWQRNDQPVATGRVSRSWTWGTTPLQVRTELYAEASGGQRVVTYWDKSRMELTDPQGSPVSPWYVTNGLLVKELVSGQVQTGNTRFVTGTPANIPVAGDSLELNPNAPTYASFASLASLKNDNRAAEAKGAAVIAQIDKAGSVRQDENFQTFGIKQSYYDTTLGHNIPDVFMAFFSRDDLVYQDSAYKSDQLFDRVFTAGLPLTEPYWTSQQISGKTLPVLVQLFERRVLTYNPANFPAWQVEMGNVGLHYYTWRYKTTPPLPVAEVVPVVASSNFARISEFNPTEYLLEIGNSAVRRNVVFSQKGGAYTGSFVNLLTGEDYMGKPGPEFSLKMAQENGNDAAKIDSDQFRLIDATIVTQDKVQSLARIRMEGSFEGNPVNLALYYEALNGQNFLRKWLVVEPFVAPGWVIKGVTLEEWQPGSALEPLKPAERYGITYADGQPNYTTSVAQDAVITTHSGQFFETAAESHSVGQHANRQEGFYFFAASLFGQESFSRDRGLQLSNTDYINPQQTFTSGKSVVGVWQGSPEMGFKSYNDYIYNFYGVIKSKRNPVVFNTWFPYETGIDETRLLDTVDRMRAAGFYDMLHVDAGWQSGGPLNVDRAKFPGGLEPVIDRLKANGKTVGIWMNPFSSVYSGLENYDQLREQHPEWVDDADPQKRFCPLSGAGIYVRDKLMDMAQNWPLEEIYWDGGDWNISNCQSVDRNWHNADEEYHATIKFYANLLNELHAVRPNLQVVVWNGQTNIHWLSAIDQLQLSDIYEPPVLESELIRNQQMYYASYQFPNRVIWGDWYGLSYKRNWEDGLGLPQNIIQYAEVSMLGNGATQAGASIDLSIAPPAVITFLNKLFSWRKQFSDYFQVYQHVLNFPDRQSIRGEAHLIDGKGFIILLNPTASSQQVEFPFDGPELALKPGTAYNLTDWTDLTAGKSLGQVQPGQKVSLTIPGYGYQIIGVNIT